MPTITDLPVGAKLKFGAYSVNGELPHKICWEKADSDGTIFSEFIEDQCAFDAKEPRSPNPNRKNHGNNRYSLSNIHQFLNAEGSNWFIPQHEYDEAPTNERMNYHRDGYAHKLGFLSYFDSWEIDAIEDSEIKIVLPTTDVEGDVKTEIIRTKVFLPSRTNLNCGKENRFAEDKVWDLFLNDRTTRRCHFSPELFENTTQQCKPTRSTQEWYYNLRTPKATDAWGVRYIGTDGSYGDTFAALEYMGIRPALKLSPNAIISDEPDIDGYYEVLSAPQEIIEINEEDFFALIKSL